MAGITMEKRRARAFEAGKEAAKKGFWETANDRVQGTIFYDDWADGWHEGQRELTSSPAPVEPKQASGLDNDYWLINIDHPRRIVEHAWSDKESPALAERDQNIRVMGFCEKCNRYLPLIGKLCQKCTEATLSTNPSSDADALREALTHAREMLGDCELNLSNYETYGDHPGTVEYLNNCAIQAWQILDAALSAETGER